MQIKFISDFSSNIYSNISECWSFSLINFNIFCIEETIEITIMILGFGIRFVFCPYIREFRISKGITRYISHFIPPTEKYPRSKNE
jgi:hypothetical protein